MLCWLVNPNLRHAPEWLDRAAYPFQNRWLTTPSGRTLHYIDEGQGDVLLFVHGTPTWSFDWRHLITMLSAEHRCIAVDLLGMGLSERPADFDYSPESHSKVIDEFVQALRLSAITLIVHDFGGPIALPLITDDRADVKRLVVINSWAWSLASDKEMAGRARIAGSPLGKLLYQWANLSLKVIMPSAYGEKRKLTPLLHAQYLAVFTDRASRGKVLWAFARALLGSSAFYERIWQRRDRLQRVRTLIIWGTKDSAFKPHVLKRWREALPKAEVVELAVGHWPQEEAPAEVTAALRRFLAK